MNKPLLTQLSRFGIATILIVVLLFQVGTLGKLQAQPRCNYISPSKANLPAFVCQGTFTSGIIVPFGGIGVDYQFQAIPPSGALPNITGTLPAYTFNWTTPGDYSFRLVRYSLPGPITNANTLCADTFFVHVSPSLVPQIAMNDTTNISLNESCTATVTGDLVMEGNYDYRDYDIIITDPATGQTIPNNPVITAAYKGKFLVVSAKHKCSPNSSWGILRVEDKLKPRLRCRSYIIDCSSPYAPENVGFPKPNPIPPAVSVPNPTPVAGKPGTYTANNVAYDNCNMVTLSYTDKTVHVQCPSPNPTPYIDTIFRDWVITDMFGNEVTCQDTVLIKKGTFTVINCPPNYDGRPGSPGPIKCSDNYKVDAKGNPHPDVTGYPTGVTCRNLDYTYNDIVIKACEGTYKILREWIVADWCTATQTTCSQLILIVDNEAPIISGAPNITVSTKANECKGEANVPLPTVLFDCSKNLTWEVKVIRSAPNCTPPANPQALEESTGITLNRDGSYHITDLAVGCNWVAFYATDPCGNTTRGATEVKVEEKTKPIAVCDLQTTVTLTDQGSAKIYAITFDDGSYDNCALDSMFVRRMTPGSCPSPIVSDDKFRNFVEFCCADVATNPNMVVFRVYDKAGNYNECMVEVTVVDKKPPVVTCLPNVTVSCGYDLTDLSIFGTYRRTDSERKNILLNDPGNTSVAQPKNWGKDGLILEDCNLKVDSSTIPSLNNCGVGTITRRYVITDGASAPVVCNQIITVTNFKPFNGDSIVWPSDIVIEGCKSSVDPSVTGSPTWPATNKCYNIIAAKEDQIFNIVEGVCYKVIRKWTVIDWCNYNKLTGAGLWTKVQIIKIKNSQGPTFTSSCKNVSVSSDNSSCTGFIELKASATDDCTGSELLKWSWEIDQSNDGSVDFRGTNNDASGTYPVGTHKVSFKVEDQCGNSSTCSYLFTINDGKKPSPYCRTGIITVIMPSSGQVTVWASDLNDKSSDNCTPQDRLRYSFSSNVTNTSRTYSCSDILDGISQTFDVRIYVTDLAGNQDYCDTKITIQDGLGNACKDNFSGGGTSALVGGNIHNENNSMVENAMVTISGNMPSLPKYNMTQHDGNYAFSSLPLNENYNIIAEKTDDPLNGVTTQDIVMIQKHILGIATLNSPYKVLAADVNNSESVTARDISDLRKLILGVTTELPIKKSWRFFPSNQQWANTAHPWPAVENYSLTNVSSDIIENNFIAVKVGDVSGNAKTNQLGATSTRTNSKLELNITDASFDVNEMVVVPVTAQQATLLDGMQLEFSYNTEALQFEGIAAQELDVHEYQINANQAGRIRISWDNAENNARAEKLFELRFTAKVKSKLSEELALQQKGFNAEAYTTNGEVLDINLNFMLGRNQKTNGFYLFQNQPNPFGTNTSISFQLPSAGHAILKIYDVNGKILKAIEGDYSAGYHNVEVTKNELKTNGILYYRLETASNRAVRKMILID